MKTKLIFFAIVGFALQTIAILGFIGIAQTEWATPGKQVVIISFLIGMSSLIYMASETISVRGLLSLSAILSLWLVTVYELLGFSVFPGLVKDTTFLSLENIKGTLLFLAIIFSCYVAGALSFSFIRKKVSAQGWGKQ